MRTEPRDEPAWRTLRATCEKLKEVIHAGVDKYLDVYARDLEYIVIGDMGDDGKGGVWWDEN